MGGPVFLTPQLEPFYAGTYFPATDTMGRPGFGRLCAAHSVPNQAIAVSPGELAKDFSAANPGLTTDMMGVACGGAGGRLKEVRICIDKAGTFRSCGRNEDQRRLCSTDRMLLPPVR